MPLNNKTNFLDYVSRKLIDIMKENDITLKKKWLVKTPDNIHQKLLFR